jgi:glycosyltransferase involved in cell wall biosynthesis
MSLLERDPRVEPLVHSAQLHHLGALRVAVIIPCRNEEATIASVVRGFSKHLPDARIYVCDNNSVDRTKAAAQQVGAIVVSEPLQGKGHVVRRMFADIEADIYVLVDGDDTYDPAAAPIMIEMLVDERLDMVTGARNPVGQAAYRPGHRLGNVLLTGLVNHIFGNRVSDVLSGYRVFSRRFVKSLPALSTGFETETEFTVHALELDMPIGEMPTRYHERPQGSVSKLRTISDGLRILRMITMLVKEQHPAPFFGAIGSLFLLSALILAIPLVVEFMRTGLVPRFPTAILATGLVLLSCISLACGVILDSVARGRKEMKRLAYLSVPALPYDW